MPPPGGASVSIGKVLLWGGNLMEGNFIVSESTELRFDCWAGLGQDAETQPRIQKLGPDPEGRGRETDRHWCVREHPMAASQMLTDWGLNLKPRCVS